MLLSLSDKYSTYRPRLCAHKVTSSLFNACTPKPRKTLTRVSAYTCFQFPSWSPKLSRRSSPAPSATASLMYRIHHRTSIAAAIGSPPSTSRCSQSLMPYSNRKPSCSSVRSCSALLPVKKYDGPCCVPKMSVARRSVSSGAFICRDISSSRSAVPLSGRMSARLCGTCSSDWFRWSASTSSEAVGTVGNRTFPVTLCSTRQRSGSTTEIGCSTNSLDTTVTDAVPPSTRRLVLGDAALVFCWWWWLGVATLPSALRDLTSDSRFARKEEYSWIPWTISRPCIADVATRSNVSSA
mmetsp:Transcript_24793/g.76672  ORF Transcript_24793/g.76672 Transcript_24793/m.76672 type:complete len:295 (+) Transcript_24793:384-1268(+)